MITAEEFKDSLMVLPSCTHELERQRLIAKTVRQILIKLENQED